MAVLDVNSGFGKKIAGCQMAAFTRGFSRTLAQFSIQSNLDASGQDCRSCSSVSSVDISQNFLCPPPPPPPLCSVTVVLSYLPFPEIEQCKLLPKLHGGTIFGGVLRLVYAHGTEAVESKFFMDGEHRILLPKD
ncbi:hypothetical protein R1flu_006970 [Riccia fluitans]|uniref:Uncharacterized protein n=1 Tax=Riccia fluitans TaxID=41844 RepID=A0ABD1YXI6_9MARC